VTDGATPVRRPLAAILGIDLGSRRIGVAVADPGSGRVRGLATIRRGSPERDAATLRRACEEHAVAEVVVGLPLHLDGREGPQARATRDWVATVAPLVGVPFALRDERLTSAVAEARLGRLPRGRSGAAPSLAALRARRARVDREAARLLLEGELDARGLGAGDGRA
jgi:putative holliday junction resolvase